MVPHFAHFKERGKTLVMVEYIPRHRKDAPFDDGQSFVIFRGIYRVRRYRLESDATGATLIDAARRGR